MSRWWMDLRCLGDVGDLESYERGSSIAVDVCMRRRDRVRRHAHSQINNIPSGAISTEFGERVYRLFLEARGRYV